jgi:hypothetical protein
METAKTMAARAARLSEINLLIEAQYGEEIRRLKSEDERLHRRVRLIVDRCRQVSNKPSPDCTWTVHKLAIKAGVVHLVYDQFFDSGFEGTYHLKFPAEWLDETFPLESCVDAVREAKERGKAAQEQRKAEEAAQAAEDLKEQELQTLATLLAKYPQGV